MIMQISHVLGLSAAGFHRIGYADWRPDGVSAAPPLVCVHGLTRNGRDFDPLAGALSPDRRVICPDIVGRGGSGRLADPAGYGYPQYLADMAVVLGRVDAPAVDWLGTSMGGLIGMVTAAQPGNPIRRLVINDVGPFIPKAALERIAGYVGQDPSFADVDAVEAYLRAVHAPFGPLTDAQWRHLAEHGHRIRDDGTLGLAYDPGIAAPFRSQPVEDVDLWPVWDAVTCPVLVLRGAASDLLSAETAMEMTRRGPPATLIEIPGCGHAPALMDDVQIGHIRDWLDA
ncbi:MAG: alpha/beta fold hydrolase [Inquilinaceae bacterium]